MIFVTVGTQDKQFLRLIRAVENAVISGKITADKFADNILSNDSITNILDEQILNEQDFKQSYINYIEKILIRVFYHVKKPKNFCRNFSFI